MILSVAAWAAALSSCVTDTEEGPAIRPIPIRQLKGYVVPADSMAPPISIPIRENNQERIVPGRKNRLPSSSISKVAEPPVLLPYAKPRQGLPHPDADDRQASRPVRLLPLSVEPPDFVQAKEMYSKDQNPANFSIFNKLQGLRHNYIGRLLEDQAGNLWAGTGDGFIRYDGKFFTHFGMNNEHAGQVFKIFEETSGVLWFQLHRSLFKYDGFKFYQLELTMDPKQVTGLLVDKDGTIWTAPATGGVDRLTPVQPASSGQAPDGDAEEVNSASGMQYKTTHFGSREGFTDAVIHEIFETRAGDHWFILRERDGLIQMQPNADPGRDVADRPSAYRFLHHDTPGLAPSSMMEDRLGNFWFTAPQGLIQYNGRSWRQVRGLWKNEVIAMPLLEDSDGNLWLSNGEYGAIRYTPTSSEGPGSLTYFTVETGLSDNNVHCMMQDRHGTIWLGTSDGLDRYNGNTLTHLTEKEGLVSNRVMSIGQDMSGALWFGSFGYGASVHDGQDFISYTKQDGLTGDYLWSLEEDGDRNLWIGALDGGVCLYTPARAGNPAAFTRFTDPAWPRTSVYTIHADATGHVWFGGAAAGTRLYRYTLPTSSEPGQLIAFTTGQGLSDDDILSIEEDKFGHLWFGSFEGGLTRYTPSLAGQAGAFVQFRKQDGIPDNRIWSITKDHRGNLWFCTDGGGLVFHDGASFVNITEKEGLSNDHVLSSLLDRDGNLWFGTRFGLSMLPKNLVDSVAEKTAAGTLLESDLLFHTYTYENGFLGVGCSLNALYQDTQGTIWVGANDRLTAYHPQGDIRDTIAPNIRLTSIDLFNEPIPWSGLAGQQDTILVLENGVKVHGLRFDGLRQWYDVPENLSLSHDNNNVTLNFLGITLGRPGRVKYQYRLDGLETNWNAPTERNFANYGHLPPGQYTFRVKAMNSERRWSPEATYSFSIRRPWWSTGRAYLTYGLLFVLAFYGALKFYKRRLLFRQQLQAEKEEALRLKELDTFKSRLFTNLTHEFRTPLTVILGMTRRLASGSWLSTVGQKERAGVADSLKMIDNNGRSLLHLINQLLDLAKLENDTFTLQSVQGDIVPYLRYVTESFQSYAEDLGLTLRFASAPDSLVMDFDPEQMKQVLTNLISNALKFTPSGGRITIDITASGSHLAIVVADTGQGIPPGDLPYVMDRFYQADNSTTRVAPGTGIGLAHTQELLKVMGGSIRLESEVGIGTRAYIQIPIRHEAHRVENHEIAQVSISPFSVTAPLSNRPDNANLSGSEEDAGTRLLVIEDNPDVVEYLRSCLEESYTVHVARDGQSGVSMAIELIPDLVISDVMMPGLDGYQVCDTLKNDERTSHIPIILLTAKADAASRLAGLRRGADVYLAKPFDPDEILVQIAMLLSNRQRMAAHFAAAFQAGRPQPLPEADIAEAAGAEDPFLQKVNAVLETHYGDESFSLTQFCQALGMSRSQLFRKMKAVADTAPSDLIRSFRLRKARTLLEKGDLSVAEVTYRTGFKDPSYFSKLFQEEFGVQPSSLTK